MPLPTPSANRRLLHRRSVSVQVYARDEGLWEVDAQLTDTKTREIATGSVTRAAGEPIHDLSLRLVVDAEFNILAAGAESHATPYPGYCDQHGDRYAQLAGLNLMQGFRRQVRERLGGTAGCTHLTELTDVLPTAVVQAFAGEVLKTRGEDGQKPFQLDRCHALVCEGAVVRTHYPQWFRQPDANKVSQNCTPVTLAALSREPAQVAPTPFVLNSRKDLP